MKFHLKVLGLFLLILGGTILILTLYRFRAEKRLLEDADSNLRDVVNAVHFSAQKFKNENDFCPECLESFVHEIGSFRSIQEVSVLDESHLVLASSDQKKIGLSRNFEEELDFYRLGGLEDTSDSQDSYRITLPLFSGKKVMGYAELSILLIDFQYSLKKIYRQRLLVITTAFIFAFLIFWYFLNRLHQPFHKLAEAAKKVSQGNFEIRLDKTGGDEEKEMAESFNKMISKISQQKELENKLRELEKRSVLTHSTANIAHEIRNPLNMINLTAHFLLDQVSNQRHIPTENLKPKLQSLKAEVDHLNKVVTHFLNLEKDGYLKKVPVSLFNIFEEIELMVSPQLMAKKISFTALGEGPGVLIADPEQLRLAFLNLILNAIQAVSQNGVVEVKWNPGEENIQIIEFIDNGHGIPEKDYERVFEPYFSTKETGIGLGLPLARRVVEDHNGTISASINLGGGARFIVKIPKG